MSHTPFNPMAGHSFPISEPGEKHYIPEADGYQHHRFPITEAGQYQHNHSIRPRRPLIVAVDVDLVVFDSLTPWLQWYKDQYGIDFKHVPGEYDLCPAMIEQARAAGIEDPRPFEFWFQSDLYDNMPPIEGCWTKINKWNTLGYQVIFVSKCVPSHEDSKRNRLKVYFPFAKGFVATGDKQFARYDVLIDDNLDNIETCREANPEAVHYMLTQVSSKVFDGVDGYNKHECAVTHWDNIPHFLG